MLSIIDKWRKRLNMTQVVRTDQNLLTFPDWGPFITLLIVCILYLDEYRYSALLSADLLQLSRKYIVGFFQRIFNIVPVSGWKESMEMWALSWRESNKYL